MWNGCIQLYREALKTLHTVIQWNLSWESTAMTDYLSQQKMHFWQKDLHFNITEPVIRDHLSWQTIFLWPMVWSFKTGSTVQWGTCLERPLKGETTFRHIFMANGVVFQKTSSTVHAYKYIYSIRARFSTILKSMYWLKVLLANHIAQINDFSRNLDLNIFENLSPDFLTDVTFLMPLSTEKDITQ